jgi:lysophospholipase L1-like esterase
MKNIKYIALALLISVTFSCENEELDALRNLGNENTGPLPELTAGTADFSKYVSLGNSLTAGFTDGTVFLAAQQNSFPTILADKMALLGGGPFTQPLVNDNFGGLALGGNRISNPRFVTTGGPPTPLESVIGPVTVTTDIALNNPTGPFNNMGVPGAASFHLLAPGYGNIANLSAGLANPYFIRMTGSTPDATIMDLAMAQSPSFVTLWIGANDVLGYATGGAANGAPTPQPTFDGAIAQIMTQLGDAQGVMANIPNVTDLPYFTTVPNNALALDAATAANLTGFFQAVTGIFAQGLIAQGVPPNDALALASQYSLTFNEGPNRFLIDVPPSPSNPLGFRQMTEEELLVLTIDQGALAQGYGSVVLTNEVLQVLGILQSGGTITPQQGALVIGAISGIDDEDALDTDEITEISTAISGFNATIQAAATSAGFGFVDANAIFQQMASGGYSDGNFTLTTDLVLGGAVSLDGVHPNSRGYALVANEFLKAIDAAYGSNFEASGNLVDLGDFPTNYSPLLQ